MQEFEKPINYRITLDDKNSFMMRKSLVNFGNSNLRLKTRKMLIASSLKRYSNLEHSIAFLISTLYIPSIPD